MTSKACKQCGKIISTHRTTCPHCGARHPTRADTIQRIKTAGVVIIALMFISYMGFFIFSGSPGDSPENISPSDSPEAAESDQITPPVLPAIDTWLNEHPAFGTPISTESMPDWYEGRRQQVRTTAGAYLFYLKGNEVVTVYRNDASGREEIWRKPGDL